MVVTNKISKILSLLEKYFLEKNDFQLTGKSYDMIMVSPEQSNIERNQWVISAKSFDDVERRKQILDILTYFQKHLEPSDYTSVSSLNIVNSSIAFIQNLRFMFPFNSPAFELSNISIGGVDISHAIILHSIILEKLVAGKAVFLNHKKEGVLFIKPISLDKYWNVKCLTKEGVDHLNSQNIESFYSSNRRIDYTDDQLLTQGYIRFVFFDDILSVS